MNSKKATRFRQWATKTLKEYITKGFVLNDDMLKNGKPFGRDYFDELLERIREIRASERRAYQKIADVFDSAAMTTTRTARQQKPSMPSYRTSCTLAVTGKTAAELISVGPPWTAPPGPDHLEGRAGRKDSEKRYPGGKKLPQ